MARDRKRRDPATGRHPVSHKNVNDTVFPQAMHLHGMHFREVSTDDALGPLPGPVLVGARKPRDIAFGAGNPGDWRVHCHILGHAASGMMTWVPVT